MEMKMAITQMRVAQHGYALRNPSGRQGLDKKSCASPRKEGAQGDAKPKGTVRFGVEVSWQHESCNGHHEDHENADDGQGHVIARFPIVAIDDHLASGRHGRRRRSGDDRHRRRRTHPVGDTFCSVDQKPFRFCTRFDRKTLPFRSEHWSLGEFPTVKGSFYQRNRRAPRTGTKEVEGTGAWGTRGLRGKVPMHLDLTDAT
eukprot:scaffold2857_cov344-Pavlova_lutheri.AAC.23